MFRMLVHSSSVCECTALTQQYTHTQSQAPEDECTSIRNMLRKKIKQVTSVGLSLFNYQDDAGSNKHKMERYLRVDLLGPGPRLLFLKKKIIYRAVVSQRLRNTGLQEYATWSPPTRPQSSELSNMKTSNLSEFGCTAVLRMFSFFVCSLWRPLLALLHLINGDGRFWTPRCLQCQRSNVLDIWTFHREILSRDVTLGTHHPVTRCNISEERRTNDYLCKSCPISVHSSISDAEWVKAAYHQKTTVKVNNSLKIPKAYLSPL